MPRPGSIWYDFDKNTDDQAPRLKWESRKCGAEGLHNLSHERRYNCRPQLYHSCLALHRRTSSAM